LTPGKFRAGSPLAQAFKACRQHLTFAGLFSALLNLLYLTPTLYMLQVYDRVVPTRGHLTLLFLTMALLLALATLSLLDMARSRILVRTGVRLERQLAHAVLDVGLAGVGPGREVMVNRAARDLDVIRQTLAGPGVLALFDAPWTPIYILVAFLIHPALGALAIVGSAALFSLTWLNERSTQGPLKKAGEAANLSYMSQQSSAAQAEVIRAMGMRRAMVQRHLQEREAAADLQLKASFSSSGLTALSRFLRLALQSFALGLGAYLAIEQKISAGAIFAASLLIGRALSPLEQVLAAWRGIGQAKEAYDNLNDLLGDQAAGPPVMELPLPKGNVQVEHLVVLNAARDGAVLNDVSFMIPAGTLVGVIGPSGAGKSTLARMIAGAGRPDRGNLRFDGAEASQWDPERLAQSIGYMPQESVLFAGTIKQNIARFADFLPQDVGDIDSQVLEAAKLAGAHDMILRLPAGYDTVLGWGGRGLAAGHTQRIAFARALFGNPSLLVLDEPNAHLDSEGEALLASALITLKQRGVTAIVVAHRTGVLAAVDRLMMLRDGRIEMFGPRDEVISRLSAGPPAAGA
jgi:PrtD family type I secretion system ABC transporter